jgi:hypothetical protein
LKKTEEGQSVRTALLLDYRERRGKMVCVKSVKLPLDDFILQVKKRKVNTIVASFTICLQDVQNCGIYS